MGEVASLIGPLSEPEVLIRCRDLFGMCSHVGVNQKKKKKKKNTPQCRRPACLVKALHPFSASVTLMFRQTNPTLLALADFITLFMKTGGGERERSPRMDFHLANSGRIP